MSEPVNSVAMKVLQPLWNQSSPRMNNCLAYSNYSYSGIGPKIRALDQILLAREVSIHDVTLFKMVSFDQFGEQVFGKVAQLRIQMCPY